MSADPKGYDTHSRLRFVRSPDINADDQVTHQIDAEGVIAYTEYDILGPVTGETVAQGTADAASTSANRSSTTASAMSCSYSSRIRC